MATVDLYKRRNMIRALEQMKPPKTFLLNTFFNFSSPTEHTTDAIDIDIFDEKRRMAEFVEPHMEGKTVEKRGYKTRSYKPGYIKNKMITNAEDILKRPFGEGMIYGTTKSPASYAAEQVGKDLLELRDMATRRMEWMASQVLQEGKVLISGDGVSTRYIDFGMKASHIITLTGTSLWTNAASNPLNDVRGWKRTLVKESGVTPNILVMGSEVMDAFINNSNVQTLLDNRRIEMGTVAPRDLGTGVTFVAKIEGVEYYEYNEYYFNVATSTDKPMVPVDGVIFGSTNAYTGTHFGVIKDLDAPAAMPFFPKSWKKEDPSARFLMVQSAPIIAMHQVDAFIYATVV